MNRQLRNRDTSEFLAALAGNQRLASLAKRLQAEEQQPFRRLGEMNESCFGLPKEGACRSLCGERRGYRISELSFSTARLTPERDRRR